MIPKNDEIINSQWQIKHTHARTISKINNTNRYNLQFLTTVPKFPTTNVNYNKQNKQMIDNHEAKEPNKTSRNNISSKKN